MLLSAYEMGQGLVAFNRPNHFELGQHGTSMLSGMLGGGRKLLHGNCRTSFRGGFLVLCPLRGSLDCNSLN